MCYIYAHKKDHPLSFDDGSSGGGCPLQYNSTTESLVFLSVTIDSIGFWLKALKHNVLERCNMYVFNVNKFFQIIPVKLPKNPDTR